MKIRIDNKFWICLAFFLFTISCSSFAIYNGTSKVFEYVSFLIVFYGIIKGINRKAFKEKIGVFLLVFFLLIVGILLQTMDYEKKITLILSMLILTSIAVFPCNFIRDKHDFKRIADSALAGMTVSVILAIVCGYSLQTKSISKFILAYGFNGGAEHKNYFAFGVLAVLIYYYYYYFTLRKELLVRLIPLLFLILFSSSHGAQIILIIFLFFLLGRKMVMVKGRQRKLWILMLICIVLFVGFKSVTYLGNNVETFGYRYRGFINYFIAYNGDAFHIFFGDAARAFATDDYNYNIRSFLGFNGSTEIAFLNILIKYGAIGLLGFILLFVYYSRKNITEKKQRYFFVLVLVQFFLSGLVESFMCNINMLYTVLMYLFLSNADRFMSVD